MAMASRKKYGALIWVWDGFLRIALVGLLLVGSEASASQNYCDDMFCHRFSGESFSEPEESHRSYWRGLFTWRALIDVPKFPPIPFFPFPSPDPPSSPPSLSPSPSLSPLPSPSQSPSRSLSPSPSSSPRSGLLPPSPYSIPALAPSPSSPAHSPPWVPPVPPVLSPPAQTPPIISPALSPSPAGASTNEVQPTSYAKSIAITVAIAFSVTLGLLGLGVFVYRRSWKPKDDMKLLTLNNGGNSSAGGGFISSTSEVWNLKPPPTNESVDLIHVQPLPNKHYNGPRRVSQAGPTPNHPSSIDTTSEVLNLKPRPSESIDSIHVVQSLPNKHHHQPGRVSQPSKTSNLPSAFPLPSLLKEDTALSPPTSTFSSSGTTFSSHPSPFLSRPTTTSAFATPQPFPSQTYNHVINQPSLASPSSLPFQTYNHVTNQPHNLTSPSPLPSQTNNPIANLHSLASPRPFTFQTYNPVNLPTLASPPDLYPSQTYYPVNLHSLDSSPSLPSQTVYNPVNPPTLASPPDLYPSQTYYPVNLHSLDSSASLPSQTVYNPVNPTSLASPSPLPPLPSQTYNPINQPSSDSQTPLASFNAVAPRPTTPLTPPRGPPPPPPTAPPPPRGPPPPPRGPPPLPPRGPPPPPLSQGFRGPPPPPLAPPLSTSNTPQLRPFHWDKLEADSKKSTVWGKLRDGSFVLDEDGIESLFGAKTNVDRPQGVVAKPKKQEILDSKKAQNIAIQIRAIKMTKDQICSALLEGDGLSSDLLEILVKMNPSPEEQKELINYSGDEAVLGPAELFLKSILEVPFAFERMRCMLYKACFKDDLHQNMESLQVLEVACKEVKSSRLFIKILEAVLKTGNRMNQGTLRGDAEAFKLDTLLKLSDVKSADGKTTLLCFVVEEIARAEGVRISSSSAPLDSKIMIDHMGFSTSLSSSASTKDAVSENEKEREYKRIGLQAVSQLSTELENVAKAASVDMNALVQSINILIGGLTGIKTLLKKCSTSDGELPEDNFFKKMSAFIQQAGDDLDSIQKELHRIMEEVNQATAYFHGKANQSEPLQLFVIVRDFLGMLEKVCIDLGKNLKSSGGG